MFAAPEEIVATVIGRLPAELHHQEGESEWLRAQRPGAPKTSFIEGPAFDEEGNLWFVDIPWGRLFMLRGDGGVEHVLSYPGEPNGLAFGKDGHAYIADHKHGIMHLDAASGEVKPYCVRPGLEAFKGTNDLIVSSKGEIFFTDQGQTGLHDPTGRLYRLSAKGEITCLLNNVPSPNGLVLAQNEEVLYLAVTRDNSIWRVPLRGTSVSKVGVFIRLSGGQGPDGLAIDVSGNLAVCHLGLGTVWVFDAIGEPMFRIRSPVGRLTTNATFGGVGGKELFITESETGSILKATLPI